MHDMSRVTMRLLPLALIGVVAALLPTGSTFFYRSITQTTTPFHDLIIAPVIATARCHWASRRFLGTALAPSLPGYRPVSGGCIAVKLLRVARRA